MFKETSTGIITSITKSTNPPYITYFLVIKCEDGISISHSVDFHKDETFTPPKKGDIVNLEMGEFFWQVA